jgi:hypothetical protein
MSRPCGSNRIDDGEREANAVFEAAAIGICAVVCERRKKLVKQVAMGGMYLDEIEACPNCPLSSPRKGAHDVVDSGLIKGTGHRVIGRERDCARRDGLPAAFFWSEEAFAAEWCGHAGFAACVGKLDSGAGSLGADEAGDLGQFGDVLVFPDAEVGRRDAALGQNGRGLNHDQSGAALGARSQVNEVPVSSEAVFGRVLAHWRNADAIGEADRSKLKWRKKWRGHQEYVRLSLKGTTTIEVDDGKAKEMQQAESLSIET